MVCDPEGRLLETFSEAQLRGLEAALRSRVQAAESPLDGAALLRAAAIAKAAQRLSRAPDALSDEVSAALSGPPEVANWARFVIQAWTRSQLEGRAGRVAALSELLERVSADPLARAWVEEALAEAR